MVNDLFGTSGFQPFFGPNKNLPYFLELLLWDPQLQLFVPNGEYKRVSKKKYDPCVRDKTNGRHLLSHGFVSNQERFNLGIRFAQLVEVQLEPNGPWLDRWVWRTLLFIEDGVVKPTKLLAKVSRYTFNTAQDAGIIAEKETYDPGRRYPLTLTGIPAYSSNWARPVALGLVRLLRGQEQMKADIPILEQEVERRKLKIMGEVDFKNIQFYDEKPVSQPSLFVEQYTAPCVTYALLNFTPKDNAAEIKGIKNDGDLVARYTKSKKKLEKAKLLSRLIELSLFKTGSTSLPFKTMRPGPPCIEHAVITEGDYIERQTWEGRFERS